MKAILMSVHAKWCAKIMNGDKTIEVRKSKPNVDLPIDVYIYCTKSNYLGFISNRYIGKVVAKFTLNKVEEIDKYQSMNPLYTLPACLTANEWCDYLGEKVGYAWHISNLEIFDKPKELSEFYQYKFIEDTNITHKEQHFRPYLKLTKAPQSFCYIEAGE